MAGSAVGPSADGARIERAPWVHLNATGLEFGTETPTGEAQPSWQAFVGALNVTWTLREALWVLVLKDFKSRYRAHSLGLFWSLAHPLVMMVTLTIAFTYVLKVQIPFFAVFYLIGGTIWQFFTNALLASAGSMVDNAGLVKQTTFPRFLFPISAVLSHLIHFGMELVLVFAFFLFYPDAYHFNATLIALPVLVALLVTILIGLALLTCMMHVKFRDLYYVLTSVITLGFWTTPILYSVSMAPPPLRPVLRLNPVTGVIEGARRIIMQGLWPTAEEIGPPVVAAVVLFVLGCFVFRRQNLKVADYL